MISDELLSQAQDEAPEPQGQVLAAPPSAPKLRRKVGKAGDGTRRQLGEEGEVQQHMQGIPAGLFRLPVPIDQAGNGLEGKKGDPQRRRQAQVLPGSGGSRQQGGKKKVQILEGAEKGQVQDDPQDHDRPAAPSLSGGAQAQKPVDQSEGDQKDHPGEPPEGAEDQAAQKQQPVPDPLSRQEIVQEPQGRQETEEEKRAVRIQFPHLPSVSMLLYRNHPETARIIAVRPRRRRNGALQRRVKPV